MATENLDLEKIELADNMQTSLLEKMNGNFEKIDTAYKQLKDLLIAKTGKDNLAEAIDYVDELVNAQDGTITADKVFSGYVGYKGKERIVGTALASGTTITPDLALAGYTYYDGGGNYKTGTMPNKANTSSAANGSVSGDNYRLQVPTTARYATNSYLTRPKASVLADLGASSMPKITFSGAVSSTYASAQGWAYNPNGTLVIYVVTNNGSYEHAYFTASSIVGTKGVGWDITVWDTSDPVDVCYACTVTGLSSYTTLNITLTTGSTSSGNDSFGVNVTITGS